MKLNGIELIITKLIIVFLILFAINKVIFFLRIDTLTRLIPNSANQAATTTPSISPSITGEIVPSPTPGLIETKGRDDKEILMETIEKGKRVGSSVWELVKTYMDAVFNNYKKETLF